MKYFLSVLHTILLLLLVSCGGVSDQLKPINLFYIQFGNQKGKIGTPAKTGGSFVLDQNRVPAFVSFDRERLTLLDTINHKIISFEYDGKLVKEIQLPQNRLFEHLSLDPDRNIYFTEKITNTKSPEFKLWLIPAGSSKIKLVRRLSPPSQKDVGSEFSRIKRIESPTENYLVIFWESLFKMTSSGQFPPNSNGTADEYLTLSRIDLINVNQTGNEGLSSFALTGKQFTPGNENKGKFARIISGSCFEEDRTVLLELLYYPDWQKNGSKEIKLQKEIFNFDLVSGRLERMELPVEKWTGFYRATDKKGIVFLESVNHSSEETEGILRIVFPVTGEEFSYRIVTDPAHFLVTDFYISRSGQIFSFFLYKTGMQVVSWQK